MTPDVEHLPDPVFVIDDDGMLLYANMTAQKVFGLNRQQYLNTSVLDMVHEDDLDMVLCSLETVTGKEVGSPIQIRLQTANGWRHFEIVGITDEKNRITIIARDTTERRRFEVSGSQLERLSCMVHNAGSILISCDKDGIIQEISTSISRQLGLDPEKIVGTALETLGTLNSQNHIKSVIVKTVKNGGAHSQWFEADLETRDGEAKPFELYAVNLLDDPLVEALIISAHDITNLRDTQNSLQHLATHDPLTGLANRTLINEHISAALGRETRNPQNVAVLFLDRFKPVNDLYGHEAGDELLCEVARRLLEAVRPGDVVGRLGGDEFVVLAEPIKNPEVNAAKLAKRLEEVLSAPYVLADATVNVYVSVGWALGSDMLDGESLLAQADAHMYTVKTGRRGQKHKDFLTIPERRELISDLTQALCECEVFENCGQIETFYQPMVDLQTKQLAGFEALVRWRHPTKGLLQPHVFLPLAEESGLDLALGHVVFQQAVDKLAEWSEKTNHLLNVSVNLSASQLCDRQAHGKLGEVLQNSPVHRENVILEVTEHTLLERPARGKSMSAQKGLVELKKLGVKLAIDDFGTGYSSLTHVRTFPVDFLKADRSFVNQIDKNARDHDIVKAVVALGHAMGMEIIGEGVANKNQERLLSETGCEFAQGYLYNKPLEGKEADKLVDELAAQLAELGTSGENTAKPAGTNTR